MPKNLAKGIFVPDKTYSAWIRFSNASGDATQADDKKDARGMAIKILGVSGKKILENDGIMDVEFDEGIYKYSI